MNKPKVALVHDYLNQYGGAEKTLEAIMELYPEAPIYTGIYNPAAVSESIRKRHIISTTNSLIGRFQKIFTFLMPSVFEGFDLRQYDLIISDGTAWPKGVLTTPQQLHIAYIHTPPRFLYHYSTESTIRQNILLKPFIHYLDNFLRIWDFSAAQRPDFLIANSAEVQKRIQKFYKRDSVIISPPVEINVNVKGERDNLRNPYYLAVGRLSAYKNFELLVQAFNLLEMPLVIIGTGLEEAKLKKIAKPNIKFLGKVSEEEKHKAYEECLGLIFPVVDEDFGIVPVEAMAHGKPVLAHKSLQTLTPGLNGMFFERPTVECLVEKLKEFDSAVRKNQFNAEQIKQSVQKYDKENFKKEFADFVKEKWEAHSAGLNEVKVLS